MTDSLNPSSRVKGWVSFTTIFTKPASHPHFLAPRISSKAQMLSPINFHFYLGQGHGGSRGWCLNTGMRWKHTMDGSFRIIFIIVILIIKQFFLYLCMKERNRDPVRVFSCWLNVLYVKSLISHMLVHFLVALSFRVLSVTPVSPEKQPCTYCLLFPMEWRWKV